MPKYSYEYVKYHFTEEEKKEIASTMATKVTELKQLEDDKKAVTSSFKSKIDEVQAQINIAANNITTGYEMRNTKCEIEIDPVAKVVNYLDPETGKILKTRKAQSEDLQMEMVKTNL